MLQSTITKMVSKYISAEESNVTDIHLRVNGENGELTAFDDDRLKLALELLQELAQQQQIILFSCQKREGAVLEELS